MSVSLIETEIGTTDNPGIIATLPPLSGQPVEFTHITTFENIAIHTRIAAGAKKRSEDNNETGDSLIMIDKLIKNTVNGVPHAYIYTLRMTIDALSPFDKLDPHAWENFREKHQLFSKNNDEPNYSDPATALTGIIRNICQQSPKLAEYIQKTDDHIKDNSPDTSLREKGFIVINEFLNYVSSMRSNYLVTHSRSLAMEDQRILNWFIKGPFSIQFTLFSLNQEGNKWNISNAYSWQALSTADIKGHNLSPYAAEPYRDSNSPMDTAIQDISASGNKSLALKLLLDKPETTYHTLPWNNSYPLTLYVTDPFSSARGFLDYCVLRRFPIPQSYFKHQDLPPSCGSATDGVTVPDTRNLNRETTEANYIYHKIQHGTLHLGSKSLIQLLETHGVDLTKPSDDFLTYTTWTSEYKSETALHGHLYPLTLTANYSYIRL